MSRCGEHLHLHSKLHIAEAPCFAAVQREASRLVVRDRERAIFPVLSSQRHNLSRRRAAFSFYGLPHFSTTKLQRCPRVIPPLRCAPLYRPKTPKFSRPASEMPSPRSRCKWQWGLTKRSYSHRYCSRKSLQTPNFPCVALEIALALVLALALALPPLALRGTKVWASAALLNMHSPTSSKDRLSAALR